jgi:membrane protease YdiL (CAAX protease family)
MISLAAGLGEEALFRGVLQSVLTQAFSPSVGLVAASLLFGFAHCVTRAYVVFATLFGLYLGWLTIINDNLLAPIVAHTLYDFAALKYLVKRHQTMS